MGVILLSAAMNARYGMSLARADVDKWIMVGVAVFADGGKAFAWIYFAAALKRRDALPAITSFLVFCACLAYATAGSLGFAAMSRAQSTSSIESQAQRVASLEADWRRVETKLAQLGAVEPPTVAAKSVQAMKQDRRFSASANCSIVSLESTRTYCAALARLEADAERSRAASLLEEELQSLRAKREAMGVVVVADRGDIQSALIGLLTNLDLATVQLSLSLLVVVLVELSACFFLWLAVSYGASTAMSGEVAKTNAKIQDALRAARPVDLVEFVESHLELSAGETTEITEIVGAYKQWCAETKRQPLSDKMIAFGLEKFRRTGGLLQEARGSQIFLKGIVLRPAASVQSKPVSSQA